MNGLSVPSLPDPNVSHGQGMTRGCGGMTVTAGGIWCSGYTLANHISSPERAGLGRLSRENDAVPFEDSVLRPGAVVTNYF